MSDATQPGAQDVQEIQPKANPRDIAIAEIAQKRAEQAAEETKDSEQYRDTEDPAPVTEPDDIPDSEAEKPSEEESEEKPQLVKIKVDGEEREVPLEQIIETGKRTLQKEVAADKRLEEATRLLREAEQRSRPQPSQDVASPQAPVLDASILEAIRYGDDNQAAEALGRLTAQVAERVPKATPDQVQAMIRAEITAHEAITRFKTEFKDIVDDPYLIKLAVQLEQENLIRGDTRPDLERFQEIGQKLREWRGTAKSTGLEEKREKKASVHLVQPASGRQPAKPIEKEPTTSEIIEKMRKARHQA